jgi:uncharacterized protein YndB with AHSA1/START domain
LLRIYIELKKSIMMEKISKKFEVPIPGKKAFAKFVNELNLWWPKEYTWSQDQLKEIKIDVKENGLCTEIGPYGFRCDWGRVTDLIQAKKIGLKWQISPAREPVPNPDKASDIIITFTENENSTSVKFEHFNFENHGEQAEEYRRMLASAQGWDYILNRFKQFCEKNS